MEAPCVLTCGNWSRCREYLAGSIRSRSAYGGPGEMPSGRVSGHESGRQPFRASWGETHEWQRKYPGSSSRHL